MDPTGTVRYQPACSPTLECQHSSESSALVLSFLDRILSSNTFARSERLARFLRYAVENAMNGAVDRLKESVVGVEVFERRPNYDPQADPIVRVEARRLRAKLQDYYCGEGSHDAVRIELPARGYVPVIHSQFPAPAGPVSRTWSIAVLPFINVSEDPRHEYFSDGLTDEVISTLGTMDDVRVVARTSVFQFKGRAADVRLVSEQLGVDHVLEGSVRWETDRVRISVQLINGRDGLGVWSRIFEQQLGSAFTVHERIAISIRDEVAARLQVGSPPIAARRLCSGFPASALYLEGRYELNHRTEQGFRRSIECFQRAIDSDPGCALAYAGLANAYSLGTRYDFFPPAESWPRALEAARKGVAIDPYLPEAHTALAFVYLHYGRDWRDAEREFRMALELNPNFVPAHQWYAWDLAVMGRHPEAIGHMQRALELDPLSPNVSADLALAFYFARRYDNVIEQCRRTLDLTPKFYRPHQLMGLALLQKGRYEEAVTEFQQATVLSGGSRKTLVLTALAYGTMERKQEAASILSSLGGGGNYVSAFDFALLHAAVGDRERMFEWLERAFAEHDGELIWLSLDPIYDSVRQDARFVALLNRIARGPTPAK